MSADDGEYPAPWLVLSHPALRQRIIVALATVAHDPATGLNWPPDDPDVLRSDALDDIFDEWELHEGSPAERLGWSLLDEAEVQALARFQAALQPLRGIKSKTVGELCGQAYWPEVARAAEALKQLMLRWGEQDPAIWERYVSERAARAAAAEADAREKAERRRQRWAPLRRLIGLR